MNCYEPPCFKRKKKQHTDIRIDKIHANNVILGSCVSKDFQLYGIPCDLLSCVLWIKPNLIVIWSILIDSPDLDSKGVSISKIFYPASIYYDPPI